MHILALGRWLEPQANVQGVNDQIFFTCSQNQILYIDLNTLDVDDGTIVGIKDFKPYDIDSLPECGLLPRNAQQNSKKNMRYYLIGY